MAHFMNIPHLDENVLADPALTRARDRVAEMVRAMPFLPGIMDDVDEALIRQCEGSNIFPRLRRGETNAHIGQVIFEIRGHIVGETLRLLEFYETVNVANTMHCVYPLPVRHSMGMLGRMHYVDEQAAVLRTAFARRNRTIDRKHDAAIERDDTKRKMNLAYRLLALEDSYKIAMRAIGAMPDKNPSVY